MLKAITLHGGSKQLSEEFKQLDVIPTVLVYSLPKMIFVFWVSVAYLGCRYCTWWLRLGCVSGVPAYRSISCPVARKAARFII
jgi:hypothetical protein